LYEEGREGVMGEVVPVDVAVRSRLILVSAVDIAE